MLIVNVFRINSLYDNVELPSYGTSLSNCFDLSFQPSEMVVKGYNRFNSPIEEPVNAYGEVTISPGDRLLIPTGLIFKIEKKLTIETYADISRSELPLQNYSLRLHPRSGLSLKKGLVLANCEGIVDVDYQEEVFVLLTNISSMIATITRGDRIAQGEIVCNEPFELSVTKERPVKHSERNGGFGSTGTS